MGNRALFGRQSTGLDLTSSQHLLLSQSQHLQKTYQSSSLLEPMTYKLLLLY